MASPNDDIASHGRYEANRKRIDFNIDEFIGRVGDKTRHCKCAKQCYKTMLRADLEKHAKVLELYRTMDLPPDERGRVFWSWVMSIYLLCVKPSGHLGDLRLPAFLKKTFCLSTWLEMMDIKESTFRKIKGSIVSTRDVVRNPHGNVGEQRALRPAIRQKVIDVVTDLAFRHAHPLPMYLSAANGGALSPDESVLIFPPSFSLRGLWSMYLGMISDPELQVSRSNFNTILGQHVPHIRVSRSEKGICDTCMAYRHRIRTVEDHKVKEVAEIWGHHLSQAVDSRDEHNACRKKAQIEWGKSQSHPLLRADLSIDYAKQAYVPVVPSGTMQDYFVQKQGLDVNMFGIFNEGSQMQTTMLSLEGARHDSNAVASQVHYYLSRLCPRVGNAKTLYIHMDSCTGQNKNNIILGYFMLRVLNGFHEKVVMKYMTVGHTKFGPDRIFGLIRRRMKEYEVLTVDEFRDEIVEKACDSSQGYVFNHYNNVRDYRTGLPSFFTKLPGFKKKFYYSVTIEKHMEKQNAVRVKTSTDPDDESIDGVFELLKSVDGIPDLECDGNFPVIGAKPIGIPRQNALRKDIFEHIRKRFPERSAEVDTWWEAYLKLIKVHSDNKRDDAEHTADGMEKNPVSPSKPDCAPTDRGNPSKRSGASVLSGSTGRKMKEKRSA